MLYHASQSWAVGGFLGVDAFFVLSGFLITTLLITEWGTARRINLAAFWLRRARRLLPALLLRDGRHPVLRRDLRRAGGSGEDPVRRLRNARLRGELEVHLRRAVVLRPVHPAVAVPAHVVARDRRAVLPDLAVDRLRRAVVHEVGEGAARQRRADDGGIGRPDGGALRAGSRSVARLLRHRYAGAVAAHGRGRVDARVPARPDPHPVRAVDVARARVRRRRVHAVALVDALGAQRRAVPWRVPARVVGRRRHHRVGDPTRSWAARPRAVVVSAPVDRDDLLRAVPLALAHLPHAHGHAHRPRGQRAAVRTARCDVRLCDGVVLPPRAPDPSRHLPHPEAGVHRAGSGWRAPRRTRAVHERGRHTARERGPALDHRGRVVRREVVCIRHRHPRGSGDDAGGARR